MLHDFIVANRDVIIERTRQRVRTRMPLTEVEAKVEHGVPLFLTQLADALVKVTSTAALRLVRTGNSTKRINETGALHGQELLKSGFTVAQVVHGYGDVCQVVTELATETHAAISSDDFHVFNRCLDDAIAGAVTAYGEQREADLAYEGTERRGVLAHELRNLLHSATLSFDVIKRGTVGLGGSTGAMLARSLSGLTTLVERSLAETRLETGSPKLQRLLVAEFIEEIQVGATMQAEGRGVSLTVAASDTNLAIDADRQLLTSALSNLLQNAFKFTRAGGNVKLLTRSTPAQVLIEVCDECGGLPAGTADHLFQPFTQGGTDRSGIGLGLTIALRAVRANAGNISVRDVPGTGCIFTIELPRQVPPPSPIVRAAPATDPSAAEVFGIASDGASAVRAPKALGGQRT
jgi:signal transduction histidine kinase